MSANPWRKFSNLFIRTIYISRGKSFKNKKPWRYWRLKWRQDKPNQQLQKKGWDISEKEIQLGLLNTIKNTGLLGRWQTLSNTPLIICDTGHNEDGIKEITKQLATLDYKQLHFVFGTVNDKNLATILPLLPKNAQYYFCKANILRGMPAKELETQAQKLALSGTSFTSVNEALNNAKENAKKDDLIFIGGSTFVVAEVL